jgi:hypothetical protein
MIDGVRASEPRRRREQRASVRGQGLVDRPQSHCEFPGGGDGGKVAKEHVAKGMVVLLVSFASCAHASVIKSKDKVRKYMVVLIGHTAVMTLLVIEFSATSRITSVSNGGGSRACRVSMGEEHMTIMEVEVPIENGHAPESHDDSSKGVCYGTLFVFW